MRNKAAEENAKQNSRQVFLANFKKNFLLALGTVPFEGMALHRILYMHAHPKVKPLSYADTLKEIGLNGLFAGLMTRATYCLTGNFATLEGMRYFGSDFQGLFLTALAKNSILPLFLASNARQINYNWPQTFHYVAKGVVNPVFHFSFCFRNLVANFCLAPGLKVRDKTYEKMNESNTQIPMLLGFGTSVLASAVINSFLKPFFTGVDTYSLKMRYLTALRTPAMLPLLLRESASLGLIFFNTSPKKAGSKEENLENGKINLKF